MISAPRLSAGRGAAPRDGWSPEARLVLAAARVRLDPLAAGELRQAAQQPLDWEAVLAYVSYHGVLSLVSKHLSECGEVVPAEVRSRLQQESRAIALRNLHQAFELAELTGALEAAGTAVISFKGPVLAHDAYGNLAYRTSKDLDLLVRRDDFETAAHLLQQRGYDPSQPAHTAEQRAAFIASTGSYDFTHREKGSQVELHWKFFPSFNAFPFDLDGLWRRQRRAPFLGGEVRVLAPEDLLVYLCVHGTKHHWLRLKWLCDVAEHVRAHADLDWEAVMRRAAEVNVRRIVRLTLLLIDQLLDSVLPEAVAAWCGKDRTAAQLARRVRADWILAHPEAPPPVMASTCWFHFRERERWRDRLPWALHSLRVAVAPNDKDRAFVHLPGALGVMYVIVRPFRIFLDKGPGPRNSRQADPAE